MSCTTYNISFFLPPAAGGSLRQQQHRKKHGVSFRYGGPSAQQFRCPDSYIGEPCGTKSFYPCVGRICMPSGMALQQPRNRKRSYSFYHLFRQVSVMFAVLSVASYQLFYQAAGQPVQRAKHQPFDPTKREVRNNVRLRVSVHQEGSLYIGEITMLQGEEVLGGFRVVLKSGQQAQVLQRLVALSENPDIFFQVDWEGKADRTGRLYIRAVLPLHASAFQPSVRFTLVYQHVRGDGVREEIPLHAEVPIEAIMRPGQDIGALKLLIVQYADPSGLLTGPGAFTITRLYVTKDPKNVETNEMAMMQWLLQLLQLEQPPAISGELVRTVEIRSVLPDTPQPTWKDILNIQLGLGEAAKRGQPASEFQKEQPGLRLTQYYLPEDGLRNAARLTDNQPGLLREIHERGGREGVNPTDVTNRYRLLFGPHYDGASNPLLFVGPQGQPIYARPGFQQYFIGPGETDPTRVPDHLEGFLMPAVNVVFRFPDGQHFTEFINPAQPWASFEEGWKPLAAKHKLKYSFREPGLRTVTINGAEYALEPEFLQHYPSLLHLLARLSESDPAFTLDSVVFNYGDKLPKQLATLFVIENYEDEGTPWCMFEFVVPLSAKGAVDLGRVMKKAAGAASSPKGCNLHEKGFHFDVLHRWGYVDQRKPLLISWKQTLDMHGNTKAEGEAFGQILKQAHLTGKQIAISFHAKHKVTAVPIIEEFGPDGKVVKVKKQRPITTVVGFGENLDGVLFDFQKPFQKRRVPTMVYPFMPAGPVKKQQPPPPAADALDDERLGPTYYHRGRKARIEFKPELPLLHPYDRFVDGTGGHPNLKPLNIPVAPGAQQFTLPIGSLRQWLNRYFPAASLPFNLNRMTDEDLEGVADHLLFKMPDGSRQPLRTIFGPQLFSPTWDSTTPGGYKFLQDFLKLPKDIMLGKNFRFVVTMPDGSQRPIDRTVEPGTPWKKFLDDFFRENPSISPQQVKLVLLDDQDQPLKHLDLNFDLYPSPYDTAVDQQRRKVAMSDPDTLEKEYPAGPDDVRARTIRDMLAAAKAGLKAKRPTVAASAKLPLLRPEENAAVAALTHEREELLRQSQKTLQQLDRLRLVRQQLKQQQREAQEPWARLKSITVTKQGGKTRPGEPSQPSQQQDIVIPLDPTLFYMNDRLWKVFKAAANARPDLQLQFDDVFDITFEVLDEKARKTWKATQQQHQKKKAAAKKKVAEKVLVDVIFADIDGSPFLTDIGVDLKLKVQTLAELSKGEKSNLIKQLRKIYNIPQAYFAHRKDFPKIQTSASRWSVTVLLGLLAGRGGAGLRPFVSNPEGFVKQLQQKGGLQPTTLITLLKANGATAKIPLSDLVVLKPDEIKGFFFPVHKPQDWKPVLEEWLRSLYDLQLLKDLPLTLRLKRVGEKDIRCTVSSFGQLLQALDDPQLLVRLCPGLNRITTPFSFEAEIRGPPTRFFKLYNRPPSSRERERSPRLLRIFKTRLQTVPEDGELTLEYAKQKRPLSPEELKKLKVILLEAKPDEDADAVITRILQMLGFPDVQIAKPGRLRFILSEKPTSEEQKIVKEGMLLVEMEDLQGGNRPMMAPLSVPPDQRIGLEAPAQLYKISFSLFAEELQQLSVPCGVKSGNEVKAATWGQICSWCNQKLAELPRLGRPLLIFKLVSKSKAQPYEGSEPVTVTLDGRPLVYDILQPGSSHGETGVPLPVFQNMVQRPGPGELGPMWQERVAPPPTKEAPKVQQRFQYIQPEPAGWEKLYRFPTAPSPPPKSVGSLNFFHTDPEAAETGKAYEAPLRWGFNFPSYNLVNAFRPTFEKLLQSVPPPERKHYKVFLEVPKGNGRMYECTGVDLSHFVDMTQEQIAAACGLDPSLLGAPFGVYLMRNTPTYAAGQPEFPYIFVDRGQEPHRGTGSWQQPPSIVIGPLLKGAGPADLIEIQFAPEVICTLTQQEIMQFKTWEAIMRKCGLAFGGEKPASLQIKLQPVFSTPNVKFQVPKTLLQPVLQQHGNAPPELLFREWPLERIVAQLLSHAQPGFFDVQLKFKDGSTIPYASCPDSYKSSPPSQIPGLVEVVIRPSVAPPSPRKGGPPPQPMIYRAGGVPELLQELRLSPDTPYDKFAARLNQQLQRPEGLTIPHTSIHIGGGGGGREGAPPEAGRPPRPGLRYTIDLITDEQPPPSGKVGVGGIIPGASVPLAAGTFPDRTPVSQILRNLSHPQVVINARPAPQYIVRGVPTFGGAPFEQVYGQLDQSMRPLVQWMATSVGVDPTQILVDFIVDQEMQRVQMNAAQLPTLTLGELLRHLGVVDLENQHTLTALPIPAPGVRAHGAEPHKLIINGHAYPGPASSPRDFGTLFGAPQFSREAAGKPPPPGPLQDLQVKIQAAPNQPVVSGIVPHDMLPWLQSISDKHGQPGLNLILNFLNQLNALSELPPGGALSIQTQLYPPGQIPTEGAWLRGAGPYGAGPSEGKVTIETGLRGPPYGGVPYTPTGVGGVSVPGGRAPPGLFYKQLRLPKKQIDLLHTPVAKLPANFALRGRAGPSGKEFFIPMTPGQRSMPVEQMLQLFGLQPHALRSITVVTGSPENGSIDVAEGAIHLQPLVGKAFTIPLQRISSSDKTPLAELIRRSGHSVQDLVGGAAEGKQLALKIKLKHGPQKQTKITTPVGTSEHLLSFLTELTLWKILPPLIDVTLVEQVWLRIVVEREYQEESEQTTSTQGENSQTQSAAASTESADTGVTTEATAPSLSPAPRSGTSAESPPATIMPTTTTAAPKENTVPTIPSPGAAGGAAAGEPEVKRPVPKPRRRGATDETAKPPATSPSSADVGGGAGAGEVKGKAPVPKPRRVAPSSDNARPPATPPPGADVEASSLPSAESTSAVPPPSGTATSEKVIPPTGPESAASAAPQSVASSSGAADASAGGAANKPGKLQRPPVPSRPEIKTSVARYLPKPLLSTELTGSRLKDTHEVFVESGESKVRQKFGDPIKGFPLLKMLVKDGLAALVPAPKTWHRCFWGTISAENTYCLPKLEFSYQYWLTKHFADVHVFIDYNCLVIKEIKDLQSSRLPSFFPMPYFYHEALIAVRIVGEKQERIYFEEDVEPVFLEQPASVFLEKEGYSVDAAVEAWRCPVMSINLTMTCTTRYSAALREETLRSIAVIPAFLLVTEPGQRPVSFLQLLKKGRFRTAKLHPSS